MRKTYYTACLLSLALVLVAGRSVAGPKVEIDKDSWMQFGFLGQVHGSSMENAADKDDIYLRRARIILSGQMMDGVKFFAETDNPNAGKNGEPAASTAIQDAWIDVRLAKHGESSEHWMEAGLILLPFSFENRATATKLLGIDYNSEAIKLVNSFVWRDYGADFHGNLGKKFGYRLGVFDGYDAYSTATLEKNDDAALRYTGHLACNLIGDVETDWFFTQDRQGAKGNYLSVGVGGDMQDNATISVSTNPAAAGIVEDSTAWVVDFQSSFNAGPTVITVNGAYYDWDNASFKGNTTFVEAGVMVGKVMPTAKYSLTDKDGSDNVQDYTAGLHYFLKGHNARAGVEYRWGDSADWTLVGIQFLL